MTALPHERFRISPEECKQEATFNEQGHAYQLTSRFKSKVGTCADRMHVLHRVLRWPHLYRCEKHHAACDPACAKPLEHFLHEAVCFIAPKSP